MSKEVKGLILGTLLSVLLAIIAGLSWKSSGTGVLVGIGAETCSLVIIVFIRMNELKDTIRKDIEEAVDLVRIAQKIEKIEDPIFTERYKYLIDELRRLAQGYYEIKTIEDVYIDDVRSIELLEKGEKLLSTCPVSRVNPSAQFNDRYYNMSNKAHLDAASRGVDITRIFLFQNKETYDNQEVQQHLSKLLKGGIQVRIVFKNDPAFRRAECLPADFLVFGTKKISIGVIGTENGTVRGAQVYTDQLMVQRHISYFKTLVDISYEYVEKGAEGKQG